MVELLKSAVTSSEKLESDILAVYQKTCIWPEGPGIQDRLIEVKALHFMLLDLIGEVR